jgi:hypothetical protein
MRSSRLNVSGLNSRVKEPLGFIVILILLNRFAIASTNLSPLVQNSSTAFASYDSSKEGLFTINRFQSSGIPEDLQPSERRIARYTRDYQNVSVRFIMLPDVLRNILGQLLP